MSDNVSDFQGGELPADMVCHSGADGVSVLRWFLCFGLAFTGAFTAMVLLGSGHNWASETWWSAQSSLSERWDGFLQAFAAAPVSVKLLGLGIYMSLCCTLLPLPTGGIIAAVATRQAALTGGGDWPIWLVAMTTTLLVATVGAGASTVANLNDYHLFTWLLRHHRIHKVRHTRTHESAARWFAKAPFFLLVIFNILPIPIDVIRMLAATCRYGRKPFALANFIGRFIRYAIIAFITYWWNLGGYAVILLLALALAAGLAKLGSAVMRKIIACRANEQA